MKFNSLIPELSVSNIEISKKFYLNIGFKIKYERLDDKFAFLELENNQIMIEEINENWNTGKLEYPFGRGINLSMTIKDLDSYYNNLVNKNIKFYKELMVNEYKVDNEIY